MATVSVDTERLDEWLENAARELPRAVTNRIKRVAVTQATEHYARLLAATTPDFDTGALKRSMTRVIRTYKRRGRQRKGTENYYLGVVGPSLVTGPHAHLVEFGTGPRWTKGRGSHYRLRRDSHGTLRAGGLWRGRMPAFPFFEAAFEAGESGGRQVIEDTLRRELTRAYQAIGKGGQAPR